MDPLWLDVRYAIRKLRSQPAFALAAILTLALGIGANTAVFSLVDAALLRPLPYPAPDRLVRLWETRERGEPARLQLALPTLIDWEAQAGPAWEGIAGWAGTQVTLTGRGAAETLFAGRVSGRFAALLGARAQRGRLIAPGDEQPGAARVCVISDQLWRSRFGAAEDVVGQALSLDGAPVVVVGVLEPRFRFDPLARAALLLPFDLASPIEQRRNLHWIEAVGRLSPAAGLEAGRSALGVVEARLESLFPDAYPRPGVLARPLRESLLGPVQPILLAVFAAVALVLLIAAGNVANLMLVHGAGRAQEVAVRSALGASRGRLVRLLLTESVLLALAGGAAGLLCASWTLSALLALVPEELLAQASYLGGVSIDGRALAFTFAVAAGAGLLAGLLPALRASRAPAQLLGDERRGGEAPARGRLRQALVVAQIALSLVLVSGAALVARSLAAMLRVDPGFRTDHLLNLEVDFPLSVRKDDARLVALHDRVLETLRALPGVRAAASSSGMPLTSSGGTIVFVADDRPAPARDAVPEANIRDVSAGYFAALGIPLLAGREFDARDAGPRSTPVAVVSRALAERYFPGEDPLGRRIHFTFQPGLPSITIVGVAADVLPGALDQPALPAVYLPFAQDTNRTAGFALRTEGDPQALAAPARRALAALEPDLAVQQVVTLEQRVAGAPWLFVRRFPAVLIGAFAALALLLALIGVYGVLASSVSQRARELAIRVALGAQGRDLQRLVLGDAAALAAAGCGLGLLLALLASRFLRSLLFGVSATDPLVLGGVAALLLAVTLLAASLPARRAARLDALAALR